MLTLTPPHQLKPICLRAAALQCSHSCPVNLNAVPTQVINATGPFVDKIRRLSDDTAPRMIMPSSGVHVTLPDYYSPEHLGMIVPKTKDGRVVFMLPWQSATIAGTTGQALLSPGLIWLSTKATEHVVDCFDDGEHLDGVMRASAALRGHAALAVSHHCGHHRLCPYMDASLQLLWSNLRPARACSWLSSIHLAQSGERGDHGMQ